MDGQPGKPRPVDPPGGGAQPPCAVRPRRVLVIEDNVDAAESLRDALECDRHEVALAFDGREGVEKAREFRPDVVLCDIGLPLMNGFEVARALKADPRLCGCYLVALSGYTLPEDQARAAEAGFARHMAKPPDLRVLERILAADEPATA